MNRFFGIEGDVSTQLAPWKLREMGLPIHIAQFRLEKLLRLRSDIAGGIIAIQPGRISDLASIPQFCWSIFMAPDDPRIELGAWFHDEGYRAQGSLVLEDGRYVKLTRKDMDAILAYECMPDLMASRWQCNAVYQSLRRLGDGWRGDSIFERFT